MDAPSPGSPVRVLAISGSLRHGASNTALLEAASRVAPVGIQVRLYAGLAELPHFNPDLEQVDDDALLPPPVHALRAMVRDADALLLSTPEYAHGLPGSFKNLLDWLVGSVDLPGKPVAILATTSRAVHAPAQLREVLQTMSTRVIEEASVVVPVAGVGTADAIAGDPALASQIRGALMALSFRRSAAAEERSSPR